MFLYLMFIFVSGCVSIYNPATERREYYFINDDMEVVLGRNLADQVFSDYRVIKKGPLVERVRHIGKKIAMVSDRPNIPYKFFVIDQDDLNAFSLPGGYIFVYKGLVEKTTVDELAFVLGHEVGHICARHSVKRLQVSLGMQMVYALALRKNDYKDIKKGVNVIYNIISLGYSRKDEFLADKLGIKYMKKAGFNPKGGISLLKKLDVLDKNHYQLILLRSHPPIKERINNIKNYLEKNIG